MAETFDANATASTTVNAATSVTAANLTVGAGANRALTVQLNFSLRTISALAVTWDFGGSAQACASIIGANATGASGFGRAELWGLVNPISGAKTLKAAWTGSSDVVINGVAWAGVNQTGGATSFAHATSTVADVSDVMTLAVTSATGNMVIACATAGGSWSSVGSTQTYINNTPANISAAGNRAAGAATTNMVFTGDATSHAQQIGVGCDIVAAAGAVVGLEWQSPLVIPSEHFRRDVVSF